MQLIKAPGPRICRNDQIASLFFYALNRISHNFRAFQQRLLSDFLHMRLIRADTVDMGAGFERFL
ncbi:Uncharacterised protein [Mycobacteroides abscessus subsp. abscessus]|nr:Uncharacterised protein [Mycobacteroides abscessus subsp. abscessus]